MKLSRGSEETQACLIDWTAAEEHTFESTNAIRMAALGGEDVRVSVERGFTQTKLTLKEEKLMNPVRPVAQNTKHLILIAAVAFVAAMVVVQPLAAQKNKVDFDLFPNPKVVDCLGTSNGPTPSAHVTVRRGSLHDTLVITAKHLKPHLAFDMFTVQRSLLLPDGSIDPNFTNFGLAWYQSDLHADESGSFTTTIQTILLDQIFGFDPDVALTPLSTFHVGFWFNNPNSAKKCGFDVTHPTPFNGEHKAGPVAMISVPDPDTNLGPLCTNPNDDGTCNP
jgi:hypothetical protein